MGSAATGLPVPPAAANLAAGSGTGWPYVGASRAAVPLQEAAAGANNFRALDQAHNDYLYNLNRRGQLALRRTANPEHYRCGVFYVNRQDPRLWVEKRVGIGWTLNFAHPAAGWMCLLMAAGAVALWWRSGRCVRL